MLLARARLAERWTETTVATEAGQPATVMHLVVSEDHLGIWLQLEGENAAEWQRLDDLAASGSRTCGPGTDVMLTRLCAIGKELDPAQRVALRSRGG
jgi:hypothetical protein